MRFCTVCFLILWVSIILAAGEEGIIEEGYMLSFFNETPTSTANEQFLSNLSIPLHVRLSSSEDAKKLLWSLLFMDKNNGKCPYLSFWELLREVFQPKFLEESYGVRRLKAIQALLFSEKEMSITSEKETLGFIGMKLSQSNETIWIYFRDLDIKYDLHQRPYVEVNITRQVLRNIKREGKEKIKEYMKTVEKTHNIIRRIHYNEIKKERRQHVNNIRERKSRVIMMNQLQEFSKKQKHHREYKNYEIPIININQGKENVSSLHFSRRCDNIRHAIETLQAQSVLPTEKRMQYLRTLEKKNCNTIMDNFFYHDKKDEHEKCDSRCPLYCNIVGKLQEWIMQSGSTVSITQLQTLYHVILLNSTGYNENENENYFSLLRQLVLDDVDRGIFSTCSGLCTISTTFQSEKKFFAGIMELLDDTSSNKEKSMMNIWWHRTPKAYLRIWEAARTGSKSAKLTLATMKEHGILSPQQTQIAARLISTSLSDSSIYFWKQILTTKTNNNNNDNLTEMKPSADKLLRFERFLGVENSWSVINEPYITRGRLNAVSTEIESSESDENSNSWTKDEISPALLRGLFTAQLYIAGIKGMPRDLKRAECILLSLLRKLRYTCDVKVEEKNYEVYFSKDDRGGACEEHIEELRFLRRNGFKMGVCASNLVDSNNMKHLQFKVLAKSKKAHFVLHDILVLLSYVQLLNGMKLSLAAEYAFQAVELGAGVFHSAMSVLPANAEQLLLKANRSDFTKLSFLRNKEWPEVSLCGKFMERVRTNGALSDLTRSGFISQESLLLLALTGREGPYPKMVVERLFGISLCSSSSTISSTTDVCDGREAVLFLLREAGRLWREAAAGGGSLVLARPDPHRADPLLLLAWLLPRLPASALHRSTAGLRPAVSDTRESYAAALRRTAESLAPQVAPKRPRNIARKTWEFIRVRKASLRRLQRLRDTLQRQFEEHHLNPLLFTSDIHSYLNYTQWTWSQRFLGIIQDTLLFPFTNTEIEVLEENLAKEIIPVKQIGGVPTEIAEQMAASVINSEYVRETSIALQLVSMSLMSGEPDGFTFILIEEMNRGNKHLHSIAYYISEHVWGNRLVETWIEQHKTAQWHKLKPKTKKYGVLFGLDSSMPFFYALPESMMELFAYITLKRVRNWQQGEVKTSHEVSSVDKGFIDNVKINDKIFRALGMCSGVLIEVAMRKGRPFPPQRPYEGMYRPVGNPLCLRQLLQYIRQTGISPFSGFSNKDAEKWLLDMLTELSIKQARYYGISLNGGSTLTDTDLDSSSPSAEENEPELRKFLVEPWNRVGDVEDDDLPPPKFGEGAYYNRRLHTVTGTYYAASLQKFYVKIKNMVTNFFPIFWL
ncbi:uncharacterized protein TM35_000024310 [Trypanosoma theileri]|uniref:Uncharacterized protein n=1 Tax=Trypanosoma theileri TaxID=67003 RepID=A0A1X0P8E6_9TRYP|nr:uncharacterized protein TM35_000024310 [Trypanosoma theileri]ORC93105.1 hypothetical protein TM35_000024310 [Trypanosoma theileri]